MTMIWNDRQGRFSWLKACALGFAVIPGLVIAYWFFTDSLMPLPVKNAIHLTGDWAVRYLVFTLSLTPLQRLFRWNRLALIRRMMGVTAFAYALTHFFLYIVMSKYDLGFVVSEIARRFYLTIGFITLLGLSALAATSTDAAVRKLGTRWKTLHKIVYGLAGLALFHYVLQSKIDVTAAMQMIALFILAMAIRVMIARRMNLGLWQLVFAAAAAAALTAGIEYAWYHFATGVNATIILKANLSLAFGPRPAAIALITGFAVATLITIQALVKNSKAMAA
jgi:methionine sulfoxide reductase heme-binding subunit